MGIVSSRISRLLSTLFTNGLPSFKTSSQYWQRRYDLGGTSGGGSYGKLAEFKAEVINTFVAEQGIESVIEFGCGDGNQLLYADYPSYVGVDISASAIKSCKSKFDDDNTKIFLLTHKCSSNQADLALSLDVIFHLVEDDVFFDYMQLLFRSAKRFVIIYSSNTDNEYKNNAPHVRHREFSKWIEINASEWSLVRTMDNKYPYDGDYSTTTFSDFYFYQRKN